VKFKHFIEEYHLREKHFNAILKTKEGELGLCSAQRNACTQQAKDASSKLETLQVKIPLLVKTEAELRKQLSIYVEKFKQVEETLNKSNELFITFRKEMDQVCTGG
jgi:chromosome segregation ATPase